MTQPTISMGLYTTAWRMLFNIVEPMYGSSFLEYHRLKCLEVLAKKGASRVTLPGKAVDVEELFENNQRFVHEDPSFAGM